jgi:hypothetical protein
VRLLACVRLPGAALNLCCISSSTNHVVRLPNYYRLSATDPPEPTTYGLKTTEYTTAHLVSSSLNLRNDYHDSAQLFLGICNIMGSTAATIMPGQHKRGPMESAISSKTAETLNADT